MASIYDKNGDICGIIVKGNSNDRIETTDSSLSGKWYKYINCNIFKNTDNVGYYLPLSFNEQNFDNTKPSKYFTYYIDSFSYSDIANNTNNKDNERCWFNYYDLMTWMNENNKWNSFWSDDQLARGYNYLSSYQGVHPEDGTYICDACKNQKYFIKPGIKHNDSSYDVIYHYYNSTKKINDYAANLYATTMTNNTMSTDVTVTASCIQKFKLGYNGILSGKGLTNYIESVDTTNPSGRPFWQRFFWVALKGGFDSGESYNVNTTKTNVKVCTFDQKTNLENASNSNLSSIPLKYKKLRTDVYLVQDDHYKTFQTYSDTNKYVIQRTYNQGSVTYYSGSPYSFDSNSWATNKSNATQFNTYNTPSWWNECEAYCHGSNSYATIIGLTDSYSVKISLPLVMNAYTATITMDRTIYITGNNGTVYTGTNVVNDYVPGKFTNAINVFCSGKHAAARFETEYKFYNSNETSWTPYINEGTKLSPQQVTYLLAGYKFILSFNDSEYWVSGNTWSDVEWTTNINNAHIFNSLTEAQEQQDLCVPSVDIAIIDRNNKGFYHVLNYYNQNATMFSSYNDAQAMISKMYNGGPDANNDYEYSPGIVDSTYQSYYTKLATNNNSTNRTSSVNMSDIPETRWLSLNYFFTPV